MNNDDIATVELLDSAGCVLLRAAAEGEILAPPAGAWLASVTTARFLDAGGNLIAQVPARLTPEPAGG